MLVKIGWIKKFVDLDIAKASSIFTQSLLKAYPKLILKKLARIPKMSA
jgi:hypothetical protein